MNNCSMVPNVEYKVKKLISDQLGIPFIKIYMDNRIDKSLGGDSLDIVELQMALEVEFGIEIDEEDMDKLFTVGEIVKFVEGGVK